MKSLSMELLVPILMFALLRLVFAGPEVADEEIETLDFSGTITQVNVKSRTLIVRTDDNPQVAFRIGNGTPITVNGEPASIDSLKTGQKIRLQVEVGSGKVIAVDAADR